MKVVKEEDEVFLKVIPNPDFIICHFPQDIYILFLHKKESQIVQRIL